MTTTARRYPLPAADSAPAELRDRSQWISWKYKTDGQKLPMKPWPVEDPDPAKKCASVDDPSTWGTFEQAMAYAKKRGWGIGYVFVSDDPYVGNDFDDIRDPDTGKIGVQDFQRIQALDSYSEISPSGKGVKTIVKAKLDRAHKKAGLEIYDRGRFFTITGDRLPGTPETIGESQAALDALILAEFGSNGHRAGPIPEIIREDTRNNTLTSLAGTMRHRGAPLEVIEAALLTANAVQCVPSLPEDEVRRIAASVARYPTNGTRPTESATGEALTALTYPLTESGDAELFAHLHGHEVRHDHARGRTLVYGGHWWTEDADGALTRMALQTMRTRRTLADDIPNKKDSQDAFKWAWQGEAKHRLVHMLDLSYSLPPITDTGREWDARPMLLGVANGVIDLEKGRLRPGQREDRVTRHTAIAFCPDAKCPRWIRNLDEVFKGDSDLIDYIWRAIGYSLTGLTLEQCLWLCFGSGANGKGVFLAILRWVLGAYAYDAPFATFELNARASIPNDMAALAGRRLVTSSETNDNTRINEARIKQLTGGDPVTARFLHGEYFTFQPELKLWLAANHKPKVTDDSHGYWRRQRLIPFTRRFEGDDADQNLEAKLRAEAPGILAWAVRGALEWQRRGLKAPTAVLTATEAYRAESDPLAQFLAEACVIRPDCTAKGAEVYKAYLGWAEAEGIRDKDRLSHIAFGQRLGERFTRTRTTAGVFYGGVGLALNQPLNVGYPT